MTGILQASLTGGEFSPYLHGRVDLARYMNSVALGRNWLFRPYGGAQNRPGTRMVAEVADSAHQARLIPFQFNTSQTYILEFGPGTIRVVKDGAQVLYSSGPNIGLPVEIATPWAEDELADLRFAQSADVMTIVHPAHAPRQLSRTAHDAWTLGLYSFTGGPFQDVNVDKTVAVYGNAVKGTVTLKSTADMFEASHVGQLFYIEQRGFGVAWESGKDVTVGTIRMSNGHYYRALSAGKTGTKIPSHTEDSMSDGGVRWLYLHSGSGVVLIQTVVGPRQATGVVQDYLPDDAVLSTGANPVTNITAISTVGGGDLQILATAAAHGFDATKVPRGFYANVVINYTGSGGANTFTGDCLITVVDANTLEINEWLPNIMPDYVSGGTGTITVALTHKWAFSAWGGDQGWPSVVGFHQQRMWFGGTPAAPETLWSTRVSDFEDFSLSVPSQDDDPIIIPRLASNQVNAVTNILSLDRLAVWTTGAVFAVGSGGEDVLTPSNHAATVQGYRGAAPGLPPIGVGNTALWVQAKGRVVRDMTFELASNSLNGSDLTVMASHLVERYPLISWAWHDSPHSMVWALREDGTLISITYLREQQVVAWARHDTVAGAFESVAVISEGEEDAAYFVVRRTINGQVKRFIERLETRLITDIREAHFVDCGLQFDGRNTGATTITATGGTSWDENEVLTLTASAPTFAYPATSDVGDHLVLIDEDGTLYRLEVLTTTSTTQAQGRLNRTLAEGLRGAATTSWAWARDTFAGLDHLEGMTVSILGDGHDMGQQVVTGGKVYPEFPAVIGRVGLPIEADLETLDLAPQAQETIVNKRKIITGLGLLVYESRSIKAGRTWDTLETAASRSEEGYDAPPALQSGVINLSIPSSWDENGRVCIRQDLPLPITILALIPNVEVGG